MATTGFKFDLDEEKKKTGLEGDNALQSAADIALQRLRDGASGVYSDDQFKQVADYYKAPILDAAAERQKKLSNLMRARGLYDSGAHTQGLLKDFEQTERDLATNVDVPLMVEQMRMKEEAARANIGQAAEIGQQQYTNYSNLRQQAFGEYATEAGLTGYAGDNETLAKEMQTFQMDMMARQQNDADLTAAVNRAATAASVTGEYVDPVTGLSYESLAKEAQRRQLDVMERGQGLQEKEQAEASAARSRQLGISEAELGIRTDQFSEQMGLSRDQFEEARRQYDLGRVDELQRMENEMGLAEGQLAEQIRQFDREMDLQYTDLGMRETQWAEQMGLSKDQFEEAKRQYDLGNANELKRIENELQMAEGQLAEQMRQFDENLSFQRERETELSNQFSLTLGLNTSQFEESKRQFDANIMAEENRLAQELNISTSQLEETKRQFDGATEQEKDALAQALTISTSQLNETMRQFDAVQIQETARMAQELGIEEDRLNETIRQFDATNQLQRDQYNSSVSQFADQLGISQAELEHAKKVHEDGNQNEIDRMEKEFGLANGQLAETIRQFDISTAFNQRMAVADATGYLPPVEVSASDLGLDRDALRMGRREDTEYARQAIKQYMEDNGMWPNTGDAVADAEEGDAAVYRIMGDIARNGSSKMGGLGMTTIAGRQFELAQSANTFEEEFRRGQLTGMFEDNPTLESTMQNAQLILQQIATTGKMSIDPVTGEAIFPAGEYQSAQVALAEADRALQREIASGRVQMGNELDASGNEILDADGKPIPTYGETLAAEIQRGQLSLQQTQVAAESSRWLAEVTGMVGADGEVSLETFGIDGTGYRNADGSVNFDRRLQLQSLASAALGAVGVSTEGWTDNHWNAFLEGGAIQTSGQLTLDARRMGGDQAARLEQFTLERRQMTLQESIADYQEAIAMSQATGVVYDPDTGAPTDAQTLQAKIANNQLELERDQMAMSANQFLISQTGIVGPVTPEQYGIDTEGLWNEDGSYNSETWFALAERAAPVLNSMGVEMNSVNLDKFFRGTLEGTTKTLSAIASERDDATAAMQRAIAQGEATGVFYDPQTGDDYDTISKQALELDRAYRRAEMTGMWAEDGYISFKDVFDADEVLFYVQGVLGMSPEEAQAYIDNFYRTVDEAGEPDPIVEDVIEGGDGGGGVTYPPDDDFIVPPYGGGNGAGVTGYVAEVVDAINNGNTPTPAQVETIIASIPEGLQDEARRAITQANTITANGNGAQPDPLFSPVNMSNFLNPDISMGYGTRLTRFGEWFQQGNYILSSQMDSPEMAAFLNTMPDNIREDVRSYLLQRTVIG